jgi:adenine phosphoribosyltransferase
MTLAERLSSKIRIVNDFPVKGIVFRDITPVLQDIPLFDEVIDCFADKFKDYNINRVVGVESRGFLFGMPLAVKMNIPFAPIRKKGKLPYKKVEAAYSLEYGANIVEMHEDALNPGDRVLIIDDLFATGGTVNAAAYLIKQLQGIPVAAAFVIKLDLKDALKLKKDIEIFSIMNC